MVPGQALTRSSQTSSGQGPKQCSATSFGKVSGQVGQGSKEVLGVQAGCGRGDRLGRLPW